MDVGTRAEVYMQERNMRKSHIIPDECSIFPADILVIIKATELIKTSNTSINRFVICADNLAAQEAKS